MSGNFRSDPQKCIINFIFCNDTVEMVQKRATSFILIPIGLPAYSKWILLMLVTSKNEGDTRIQNDNNQS